MLATSILEWIQSLQHLRLVLRVNEIVKRSFFAKVDGLTPLFLVKDERNYDETPRSRAGSAGGCRTGSHFKVMNDLSLLSFIPPISRGPVEGNDHGTQFNIL